MPPALQGHTPDIVPRFDPDARARAPASAGVTGAAPGLEIAGVELARDFLLMVSEELERALGSTCPSAVDARAALPVGTAEVAPIVFTGWLPGYADPEYFLRLLFQSDSQTNEGGFAYPRSTS